MPGKILVTGGAGFIGSHVVELLLEKGRDVVVYDALVDQVHRGAGPVNVPNDAKFVHGDMRDRAAVASALEGVEAVVHLAAEVGVGQSMYEISRYVDANTSGTGVLLDVIANQPTDIERIVVASSMSIYGEGAYVCAEHGEVHPHLRSSAQLEARDWDPRCPRCGEPVTPIGTHELKPLRPTSVYAISKMDQELLCLSVGGAYDIGVVALRYFNAYGPRQALSNPYTGVAAIFSSRLLNGRAPLAFEDGQQLRDFIHVRDVARATVTALESPAADGEAINVGTDDPMTVTAVARSLASALGVDLEPELTGTARAGDIRHCYADMSKADALLGFRPEIDFDTGVSELIEWVSAQQAHDLVDRAQRELAARGLAR
ncbi:MAG: NAD-dependent epimerase/dehydratase family protein [Solirubrobacteraceae bacterium]